MIDAHQGQVSSRPQVADVSIDPPSRIITPPRAQDRRACLYFRSLLAGIST
jgi:hypothetical protein